MPIGVSNNIPLQGNPVLRDLRNPTLLPHFYLPAFTGQTLDLAAPAMQLINTARVDATATATISGAVTTGDEITIQISNGIFGSPRFNNGLGLSPPVISHTYTTVGADTVTLIAEALAFLFNDDANAQIAGLRADAAAGVITFHMEGPVANLSVISAPGTEPSKVTAGGTAVTGDVIAVLFQFPQQPVAAATAQAFVTGNVAATDTLSMIFTNAGVAGLPITKTYTVVAGDTINSIAAGLTALINADTTLGPAGIQATSVGNEIVVSQEGAIGNTTVLTTSNTHGGGGTEILTFVPSNGHLSGGSGQPGGVLCTFNSTTANTVTQQGAGITAAITANGVLAGLSITAVNAAGVVTITVPAAAEPVVITSWVNVIAPTAVIAGAIALNDVLNITITNAALTGGSQLISITAIGADTTTTLAAKFAAAINANTNCQQAGISATNTTNTVNFFYQQANGSIRFSQSVSPGSETITLTAAPTDTLVYAATGAEAVALVQFTGGSGPVAITDNFVFTMGSQTRAFWYGDVVALDFNVITAMVAQGMPIQ